MNDPLRSVLEGKKKKIRILVTSIWHDFVLFLRMNILAEGGAEETSSSHLLMDELTSEPRGLVVRER